ncbi:MAG TPA: AraC family transcriptional regulator [Blastocatellia bacterium]|nr:AraC family transcriptional regulator [Blastocatellia bacterium]
MDTEERRDLIEVWRPHDLARLELQRGFAVNRLVPRHWHEEYQLCLIQSGPGELNYRGSCLQTPPASLFVVHPGEVHSNRTHVQSGCSYRTLFVPAELMREASREIFGGAVGMPFFPAAVIFDEQVIHHYLRLHVALERPSSSLERQALLLDLLAVLVARFAERRLAPRACADDRRSVGRAYDYLAEHYAENVPLDRLAAIAGLSPFHFNRVFADRFGMPPHAFQTQLRVLRAKRLLLEGGAIPQVASQTGFADQSHLTRHFKRLVGMPPGQYQAGSKNVQDAPPSPR